MTWQSRLWNNPMRSTAKLSAVLTALLALCVATLWSGVAFAGDVVVAQFEGAKPDGVRDIVVEVLTDAGYDVESPGAAPSVDPAGSDSYFVGLAEDGGYKAFVTGYTSLKSNGWTTSITVRDGASGSVIGKVAIKSGWYPGLQKALRKQLKQRIDGPLSRAKAPAGAGKASKASKEPEPKPKKIEPPEEEEEAAEEEEAPPEEEEPATTEEEEEETRVSISDDGPTPPPSMRDRLKKDPLLPALDLDVGGLMVYRKWRVEDALQGAPDGPLSPLHYVTLGGAKVSAQLYPLAFSKSKSFARHIGLEASFGRTFVGDTVLVDAATEDRRKTTFQEVTGGLRARIPAGTARFGIFAGAGLQKLTIEGEKRLAAQPDANYTFYRAGADAAIALMKKTLTIELSGAFRGILKMGDATGQIQGDRWFPDATGSGVDGRLEVSYLLSDMFAVRLGGTVARYALAFNLDPQDVADAGAAGQSAPPVAGGATDLYAGGDLSIALLLQ